MAERIGGTAEALIYINLFHPQASRPPGFAVTHECSVPTLLHPSHKEFDSPRHMCDRRYCLVSPHGVAPSLPYLPRSPGTYKSWIFIASGILARPAEAPGDQELSKWLNFHWFWKPGEASGNSRRPGRFKIVDFHFH